MRELLMSPAQGQAPAKTAELGDVAAAATQPVIEKTLKHLGLQARAPLRAAARGQALQAA